MKSKKAKLTMSGLQLIALSAAAGEPGILKPEYAEANPRARDSVSHMSHADLRGIESAHLEIYAACKWGRASFDPQEDEHTSLSNAVAALYANMDRSLSHV